MKVRIIAVAVGVVAVLGFGAAPAIAAPANLCVHPVLYPYCG